MTATPSHGRSHAAPFLLLPVRSAKEPNTEVPFQTRRCSITTRFSTGVPYSSKSLCLLSRRVTITPGSAPFSVNECPSSVSLLSDSANKDIHVVSHVFVMRWSCSSGGNGPHPYLGRRTDGRLVTCYSVLVRQARPRERLHSCIFSAHLHSTSKLGSRA